MNVSIGEHVPLAPFTTLGIGGPARYFIHARSETVVQPAIEFAKTENLPLLVLGGGSNLLVADEGFNGVVLRIEVGGIQWNDHPLSSEVIAGGGEEWDRVVAQSVERDLYGLECLSGIPGSVGGTPVQNVGAYGQEISETLVHVRAYDRRMDRFVELSREDCRFQYRSSIFNTTDRERYIVTAVTYSLRKNGRPAIQYADLQREFEHTTNPTLAAVREAVRRIRARKAMLLQPGDPDSHSAGSFFKNPILTEETLAEIEAQTSEKLPRYPAGAGYAKTAAAWLIEHAGFTRGFSMNLAGISTRHTLALVNKGGATAADVIKLAREIRHRVEDRFGIRLAVEPVFVGFDRVTTAEFEN